MTSLPSAHNLNCDKSDDGKLNPPSLLHAPRLQVPTISVTDKTPTPTKLLKAADEIGLFQDVDLSREIDPQKGARNKNASIGSDSTVHITPQSSSTVTSANPFEAAFARNRLRTASCSSGVIPLSSPSVETEINSVIEKKFSPETLNTPQIFSSKAVDDESINTPQIFPSLQDVVSLPVTPAIQPVSSSIPYYSRVNHLNKQNITPTKAKLRSIAPKGFGERSASNSDVIDEDGGENTKDSSAFTSAELIIKLPNGEMLPLSKLPVTKEKGLRGYSIGNPSADNDGISSQFTTKFKASSTYNSNTSNSRSENSKEILRSMLENKEKCSAAPKNSDKTSTSVFSVVQVDHGEQNVQIDEVKPNLYSDGYRNLKKESNKAAAQRSRMKKKSFEYYNNEIRKRLQDVNSKLVMENNMLRNEVERLTTILNSHKNCAISLDETREEISENSRMSLNVESRDLSSFPTNSTTSIVMPESLQPPNSINKIYKILSIDPLEVNRSLSNVPKAYEMSQKNNLLQHRNGVVQDNCSKVYTGHTNSDADNTQVIDLSFNENEGDIPEKRNSSRRFYSHKRGPDVLIQAMTELDEKHANVKATYSSKKTPSASSVDTEAHSNPEHFLVQGSPGFVRVTSNSIAVSQPMAKKMKRFVFGKSFGATVTPNTTSSDTDF